jgi:hypothetical protein
MAGGMTAIAIGGNGRLSFDDALQIIAWKNSGCMAFLSIRNRLIQIK